MQTRTKTTRDLLHSVGRPVWSAGLFACSLVAAGPAAGQQTFFYSLEGTFNSASEQNFDLILIDQDSAEGLAFRTFHHSGGTNAAGDVIPAGSFDPIVELFDSSRTTSFGVNDDFNSPNRDSLLTWPGSPLVTNPIGNTPLSPDPLANGFYSLQLRPFSAPASGDWALDITTQDSIDFTGIENNAGGTISSLKFGYTGTGSSAPPRVQNIDLNGIETITGELVVGVIGEGRYEVQLGTTHVGGLTTVNAGSELRAFTNGTFNANGGVLLNGGTLIEASDGNFNLGSGQTFTANNGGQITFDAARYNISGNQTFSIDSTSDFTTADGLDVGTFGTGNLTVDGADSTLDVNGGSMFVGFNGGNGSVTIRNNATAEIDNDIFMSVGNNDQSMVAVQSAATFDIAGLRIADDTFAGTNNTASFTVTGNMSTVTQAGAANLSIGSASGTGSGTLDVTNGGVFNTGTGTTTIGKTGTLNISSTFNANGDINLVGGTINSTGNNLNLAAGKTLTASAGGQLNITSGSQVINGQATYRITDGADFSLARDLGVGIFTDGTLIVEGSGSTLTVNTAGVGFVSDVGFGGGTGVVTIRDEAMATFTQGPLNIADSANNNSNGTVNIESGATVSTNSIAIATQNVATGVLNITGPDSMLTQTGASITEIGSGGTSSATVTVADSATLNTGTGLTTIGANGQVNVNTGGTFNAKGELQINGGSLTVDSASTFDPDGDITVDGGTLTHSNLPGNNLWLAAGRSLSAINNSQVNLTGDTLKTLFITEGQALTVSSGADLDAAAQITIGDFSTTGKLTIEGTRSSLNHSVVGVFLGDTGGTGIFQVLDDASAVILDLSVNGNGNNADSNGTATVSGGADLTTRQISVGSVDGYAGTGTLKLDGAGSTLTQTGASSLIIGNADTPGNGGVHTVNVTDSAIFNTGTGTTTIRKTGTLNINTDGTFNTNGDLSIFAGTVNVLGGTLNAGTVNVLGGGSFNFGFGGTLSVETFNGNLTQDGGFLSPGNSPGTSTINGDYNLISGFINIELAGTAPGTQHDNVDVNGTLDLGLSTGLNLSLIDGFNPTAGDTFDILDFDAISGEFVFFSLPTLGQGLVWDDSQLHTDGSLSVFTLGDLNADGILTNADIAPFVQALNDPTGYTNAFPGLDADRLGDFNDDGILTHADIAGFVAALTGGGASPVPEPGSLALLGGGLVLLSRRRRF